MSTTIPQDGADVFRLIAGSVRDFAIFAIGLDGRVASWNPGVEQLLGYAEDEWVGRDSCDIFTPEDNARGECAREMRTALECGRAEDRRWHLRKDGTRFWADGQLVALRDAAGEARGFAKIMRDETGRKTTEEELRRTKARLESALEAGLAGTFYWDIRRDRIITDENMRRYFSLRGEATGDGVPLAEVLPAVHGDDRERVGRALREALESSGSYAVEYRVSHPEGVRWLSARGRVERGDDGAVTGMPGFAVDITDRKHAEEVLREGEERYRTLFESIDEGFCVLQMLFDEGGRASDYRFVELNPAFERLTGIPAVQALGGKTVRQLIPDLEGHWVETYGRVALTGEPIRFESHSEVMGRWFDVYAFRVGRPEERKVALIFKNITARRRAEEERERLHRSLEFERSRLADIFTRAPAFVATTRGPEHVFELVNPAYLRLVGHRDLIGRTVREALPEVEGQGFFELLDGVYGAGEPYEGREMAVTLQREPGARPEERLVDFLYQPLFEADGGVSGIFVHGVDVTEQVEARKRAEEANRLKDDFLATLSHELRTPLTSILGWSRMLQTNRFDEAVTARALQTIERNAQAQAQLVDDLLDVSRIITGKLRLDVRPVDLSGVITAAADSVRPAAEAKEIELRTLLDPAAGAVSGDPERLQQVVWNLLSNAVKFTPKGGRVEVRLERADSQVEITVADTGRGIAPEFLPHVFDRFRQADQATTRQHGGLGLGLSIVRQLVELHGGTVEVRSEGEGRGATFTVSLPPLPARAGRADGGRRVNPASRTGGALDCPPGLEGLRVLVVDDEADTREVLLAVLASCGAQPTAAASAAEALRLLGRERYDVLVSDIGMPEEDGYDLIRRVRALAGERGGTIPAVALTAYARAEDRMRALRSGFQMHVPKPVEPAELITVVANLAGRGGGGFIRG
ncbi:MAG TPA: PAS domain S-box protein [Pyrinomonadaceae bacterium]|jgi:PAS domain S-box-containing protein